MVDCLLKTRGGISTLLEQFVWAPDSGEIGQNRLVFECIFVLEFVFVFVFVFVPVFVL